MDLDNGLGLLQANSQALILAPQPGVLFRLRIHLGSTLLWSQRSKHTALALQAPLVQMRRVEPLAPQQGADLATTSAGIGLGQDAQLVLGAESAALGLRYDFRVSLHRRRSGRSVLRYC